MNRLQKKCFIASTGIHLLIAITLIAPSLMSSPGKAVDMPVLEFIPDVTTDKQFSGGGNPNAKPPPPALPAPKPPEPVVTKAKPLPEPPKQDPKPPKADPEALEPEPKKPKIQLNTTPVVRKTNSNPKTAPKKSAAPDTREQEMADARRLSDLINRTAGSLREDLSSSTSFEMPGKGGGQAYANYGQVVTSIYERLWIAPEDAANDAAITKVTVTIASDGTVLSARIIKPCGDRQVDNSVQRTLDRVSFIAPFPDGAKEKQRTYTINFNLKARRLLG